jgi:hypothetical protein
MLLNLSLPKNDYVWKEGEEDEEDDRDEGY